MSQCTPSTTVIKIKKKNFFKLKKKKQKPTFELIRGHRETNPKSKEKQVPPSREEN
jgi:hypothetical protein